MTIEQTVDVPDSHRLVLDVPRDIPAGKTILTFTLKPIHDKKRDANMDWLGKIYSVNAAKPFKREDLYDR